MQVPGRGVGDLEARVRRIEFGDLDAAIGTLDIAYPH
jgi:hypothetical protein